MKLRYKIGLILAVLGVTFGLGMCKQRAISGPKPSAPAVLPKDDIEQITVNPDTHQLIVLGPNNKSTITYLPDRSSVIDIKKDGSVKVTSAQFGLEHKVFIGVTGSDHFRAAVGMDGFFWKKLDVGLGVADRIGNYMPVVFAKVSYNIYSNSQLGITYDNQKHIGLALTIRI